MMLHGLIAMIAVNLQRIPAYNALNLRGGCPLLEFRTPQEVIRRSYVMKKSGESFNARHMMCQIGDRLRGCPETKSLKDNILCAVLGKTRNGITG